MSLPEHEDFPSKLVGLFLVGSVILCVLLCVGCAAIGKAVGIEKIGDIMPISKREANRQDQETRNEIWKLGGVVAGLTAQIENDVVTKQVQIQNQLWPVVVLVTILAVAIPGFLLLALALAAYLLLRFWLKHRRKGLLK